MAVSKKTRQKRIGDIAGGVLGILFGVLVLVRGFYAVLQSMITYGNIWLKRGVNVYAGKCVHEGAAAAFDMGYTPLDWLFY